MKVLAVISGTLTVLLVLIALDNTGYTDYRLPADEFWLRVMILSVLILVSMTVFIVSGTVCIIKKLTDSRPTL